MSRRTNAASRSAPPAAEAGRRRIRTTVGALVAAAWDALGPDASPEDVARLLRRVRARCATRPGLEIDEA